MASYDIVQSVYLMSQAANGVWDISASQTDLVTYLTTFLNGGTDINGNAFQGFFPQFNSSMPGGDWEVVWGPCVYIEGGGPGPGTNAMFVAYSKNESTYVVAVAGTDFDSPYDWLYEDGNVDPNWMVSWPPTLPYSAPPTAPGIPSGAALSAATTQALSNVLCASEMRNASGQDLKTYLSGQMNTGDTLIFTGHSLGGAVAPTLAFFLYEEPPQSWMEILVLPIAGASPGNAKFATAYTSAYGQADTNIKGAAYPYWNVDYTNKRDVVPHAWNQLPGLVTLVKAKPLYFKSIYGCLNSSIGSGLAGVLSAAENTVAGGDYMNLTQFVFPPNWGYWPPTPSSKPGYLVYPPTWTALPTHFPNNPITLLSDLYLNVDAAHIDQYANFFGVIPPQPLPTSSSSELQVKPISTRTARKQALLAAARLDPRDPESIS